MLYKLKYFEGMRFRERLTVFCPSIVCDIIVTFRRNTEWDGFRSNVMSWAVTLHADHRCHLVKKTFFKIRVDIYKPWLYFLRDSFLFAARDNLRWDRGGLTVYSSLGCRTSHQGHIRNITKKETWKVAGTLNYSCNYLLGSKLAFRSVKCEQLPCLR